MKGSFKGSKNSRIILNIEKRTLKVLFLIFIIMILGSFLLGYFLGNKFSKKTVIAEQNLSQIKTNNSEKEKIKNQVKYISEIPNNKDDKDIYKKLPKKISIPDKTKKNNKEKFYSIFAFTERSKNSAKQRQEILKARGYDCEVIKVRYPDTGVWYRLKIGKFVTQSQAHLQGRKLKKYGLIPTFFIARY